jgi:PAS domain S-box-containing protein
VSTQEAGGAAAGPELFATSEMATALAALTNPVFAFKAVRDQDGTVVDLRHVFLNEAAARLLGQPIESVLGRGQLEVYPSAREAGIWDTYLRVLESGTPEVFDVPWFQENGVEGSFRLAASRFGDGILASAQDITEQRRAEKTLGADRAALRSVVDSLLDPHVLLEAVRDETGQIIDFACVDANPAARAYLGLDQQDLIGRRLLDIFPGQGRAGLMDLYRDVVTTGEPLELNDHADAYAYGQETRGGEERFFDVRAARVGDGMSYTWRDVSDRHLAERRLRAAHDSMLDPQVLYEAIRDESGKVVDFRFVDANPAACEYNRWDREQLIGSTLLDQWPDFANDPTREAYAQVLATGEPIMLDDAAWAQQRLFGGQIRHYDLRAVRVSDSLLSVTWRDSTERYAKTEHDQRMAVIVESSPEAIIGTVLPDATIVSWNPAAERMYGYTAGEVTGRPVHFLTPEHQRARSRAVADAFAAGESMPEFETVRLRKDGSQVQVSISVSTICDDDGNVTGFVSFHRDITQQAESRRELAAQQAGEQRRLAELEQFQRLTVGRELKMMELKKEIEYLRKSGPQAEGDPADKS